MFISEGPGQGGSARVVVDDLEAGLIEAGSQVALGDRKAHGVGNTLAQGTCGVPSGAQHHKYSLPHNPGSKIIVSDHATESSVKL